MIVSNSQPVSDKVVQRSQNTLEIKLPSYHTDSNNVYTLSAVACDSKGNASKRAVTQLTVTAPHVSVTHSLPIIVDAQNSTYGFAVSKSRITANRKDEATLAFTAKKENDRIRGLKVSFKRNDEADTTLSAVTEHNELYIATLTGILTKRVTITPHIDGQAVERVAAETVTFTAARVDFDESSFSSSSGILFTDGQDKVTLAFTAKDRHNQPVRGLVINFNKENQPSGFSTILSDITETNGVYRATLTATTKGSKEAISELMDFRLMIDGKPAGW